MLAKNLWLGVVFSTIAGGDSSDSFAQSVPGVPIDCAIYNTKAIKGEWRRTGRSLEIPFKYAARAGEHCVASGYYIFGMNSNGSPGGKRWFDNAIITPTSVTIALSDSVTATFTISSDEDVKGEWKDSKTGEVLQGRFKFVQQ